MRREILGERHRDVITATHNLAIIYARLGRLRESEELQIRVLEERRLGLGESHPDTVEAASTLACIYVRLGQLEKAEKLQIKVLQMRREILGENHQDTISALQTLQIIYRRQERRKKVKKLEHQGRTSKLESKGLRENPTAPISTSHNPSKTELFRHIMNVIKESQPDKMFPQLQPSSKHSTHAKAMIASARLTGYRLMKCEYESCPISDNAKAKKS
jgi:hypothetical protein